MAFWGLEVKPGEPYVFNNDQIESSLVLTQATLGVGTSSKKSTLQVEVGDKDPVFLCTLLPGKIECFNLNLEFDEELDVKFSVVGPTSIHISGYIQATEDDDDHDDDCCDDSLEDSDEMELEDTDSDSEDEDEDNIMSDSDMPMDPRSTSRKSGVVIEEIEDEEEPVGEKAGNKQIKKKKDSDKKAQQQIVVKGKTSGLVSESEDEDGFPVSSSGKGEIADNGKGKKKKNDGKQDVESASSLKRKIDAMDQDKEPKSAAIEGDASEDKKKKKKKAAKTEKDETVTNSKQDKAKEEKQVSTEKETKQSKTKPSKVRTFANGLIIEDIQMGKPDGRRASAGKKVSVHYIGKLKKTGAIFDSNIKPQKPFKFRLGVGQVIKGWDVGVEGMRVGDKRRLTIPPSMGYGSSGAAPKIPPNAWLLFDVELVNVA